MTTIGPAGSNRVVPDEHPFRMFFFLFFSLRHTRNTTLRHRWPLHTHTRTHRTHKARRHSRTHAHAHKQHSHTRTHTRTQHTIARERRRRGLSHTLLGGTRTASACPLSQKAAVTLKPRMQRTRRAAASKEQQAL